MEKNKDTKPVGRPTKYHPKFCDEIVEYFDRKPYTVSKIITTGKNDYRKEETKRFANELPTFHGFARKIGVNEDTVVEWSSARYPDDYADKDLAGALKYPNFSAAYKRAKELQKYFIIENGLGGLYNAAFAIFVAKNITDMKDVQKVETDHTSKGEKIGGFNYVTPNAEHDNTDNQTND